MITKLEHNILKDIDNMVAHANDDELFAGGYLSGYLTLAVALCQEKEENSAKQLEFRVKNSLQEAIKSGELSPQNQKLVLELWQKLFHRAQCAIEE